MKKWTVPKYSGSRRTKAGLALAAGSETDLEARCEGALHEHQALRLRTGAQEYLFEIERQFADKPWVQVVQVSVEKVEALETAYPNYYLDTTVFLDALRRAIA
jgi:hypothetical protein